MQDVMVKVKFMPCGCRTELHHTQFENLIIGVSDNEAEGLHYMQDSGSVPGYELLPSRYCDCTVGEICDDPDLLRDRMVNIA